MIAWRRFLLETVLCVVLIAAIVLVAFRASNNLLAGAAVGACVTAILRILWRRG
jgi:hypothetical protein